MKIAVIGYSGAGKSTLADWLAGLYNCEVLHLDKVQFSAGWQLRDRDEALLQVEHFMAKESWVIDGNYQGFLQARRLEEADQIIFLNFPRLLCLKRAWHRYRTYRGRSRPDMAEGCDEKLDGEFIRWILWEGRTRERREHFHQIQRRYGQKTVMLKNQKELDQFMEGLRQKGSVR